MSSKFGDWLLDELGKRGWQQGELCTRAHIDSGTLSNIISGRRNAGDTSARGIARAFNIPEHEVFRQAGLMTSSHLTKESKTFRALQEKIETLAPDELPEVNRFVDFVLFGRGRKRLVDQAMQKNDPAENPGTSK